MDEKISERIGKANIYQVRARSVLTCESSSGICKMCYGLNLATNNCQKEVMR